MTPGRVVQLITQDEGGPATHTADVAGVLAQRGWDSHVVGPAGPAAGDAEAAGVTWHRLDVRDKRDRQGVAAVVGRLRALAPDVLHLQDRRSGMVGRLLRPALPGTAVVYTLHGVADGLADLVPGNVRAAPRRRRDRVYYLMAERLLARLGDRVVVPSRAVADFATTHIGVPAHRVAVVPNGVDPDHHRVVGASPGRGRDGRARVVWLGGLMPVKRPDLFVDALAAVPGLEGVLVGDGPLCDDVRRRIERHGVADRVRLAGFLPDPRSELESADAYALTSVAENCPLALLQAMATGLPVVVPGVGGVPEVVRDDREGIVLPAGDLSALTAALQRVAGDQELRARHGAAARARVQEHYTLDRCVDGLVDVYGRARR